SRPLRLCGERPCNGCSTEQCDELPSPHELCPQAEVYILAHREIMNRASHSSKIGRSMSLMGQSRRTNAAKASPDVRCASNSDQTFAPQRNAALCRFCCRSPLQAFLVGDPVAVM